LIAQLQGALAEKQISHVVVDVGGVGYRVFITTNCFYALPEPPEAVTLLIHTVVREDAFHLYGFLTELERRLFALLLSVSGIGPKNALAALSGFTAEDLLAAIAANDGKKISKVPGIGKKTAERIVVDLSDKAAALMQEAKVEPSRPVTVSNVDQDAVSALINLGYREAAAEQAVAAARHEAGEQASLEDIIRAALKRMMKG